MSNKSTQINVSNFVSKASKKLLATTAMTALGLFGLSSGSYAADDWTGHTVVGGDGSIAYDAAAPANTTNIIQSGNRVKVQGDADIKAGWTVNVAQDSKSSQYILYDVEDGKSIIDGNLNANGEIFIFDRDGVIFGENSQVDVSAIIASSGTLTSTDAQLDNGQVNIAVVDGDGPVKSFGTITVGNPGEVGGLAGFVAPNVVNNGIINATMSSVTMAAGETVTLDLYGDGLVEIAVDGELEDGLIKNTGTINANGGKVVLSAAIAKDAVENVINTTGMINASSATVKGGKIILDGGSRGQVRVNGDVRANGNNGQDAGSIEIAGENVVITDDGDVRARSIFGGTANAGEIILAADSNLTIKGEVSAYGIDDTGHVYIRRTEIGSIGVGTGDGDFLVSQDEVNNIIAGALTIGGDNTTEVNVEDIDMTAFKDAYLHALAASSVNFFGFNSFDNLTAVANDVTLNSGSTVDALASIYFDAPIVNLDGNLEAPSISGTATTVNVNNDGNPIVGNEEIQDGLDVAAKGGTVNVGAGDYVESVLINKAVSVIGAGRSNTFVTSGSSAQNAFTVDGDLSNSAGNDGRVGIFRMDINNSKNGVEVLGSATNLNDIVIGGASFTNNVLTGVRVNDEGARKTFMQNTNFVNNGTSTTSGNGDGDILFWKYNGDVELNNVNISNDSGLASDGEFAADYGIQFRGSDTPASAGEIKLDNFQIAGRYRAALLGLQNYATLPSVSMNDVTIGGLVAGTPSTNSGGFAALYLGNIGEGDFSLGNTKFVDLDPSINFITNYTLANIDARGVNFEGVNGATASEAENFAIEDRVTHKMDFPDAGLVTWKDGNVFVTKNTAGIQNAIDISDAGNTVNVNDGTFTENLLIDKSIKLAGFGTTLEYDVAGTGPGRGGNGNIITVTAADVNIDPITFDGLGVADFGVNADGTGAAGLVVDGNTFKNFNEAGVFVAHSGASIGSIINNTFEGSSTRGVEVGTLDSGYTLNITDNVIGTDSEKVVNGLRFVEEIKNGSDVVIAGNTINSSNTSILAVEDIKGTGTTFTAQNNVLNADNNGFDIDHVGNNALVTIGGAGYDQGNKINAKNGNGIEFDAGVDSDVLIQANQISAGKDGINVRDSDRDHTTGVDNGATVQILDNAIGSDGKDTIGQDGINFDDSITGGSTVTIAGNSIGRAGAYVGDDGIDIETIEYGSTVNIVSNPNNYARDNGVEINGNINDAILNVSGNNHGIHAGDHGIYVGEFVYNGSEINIHDNIISANEDNDSVGDGIHFAKNIYTANINIGDGNGSSFYSSPSNYIRGKDGIHFAGDLNSGSNLNVDGNRIGYGKTSSGYAFADRVSDDGIQILGDVQGDANVQITDNYINSNDDGVSIGDVEDDARVIIGGVNDGNTINADGNGDGVQFFGDVEDHSTVTITHNEIQADKNAVMFSGDTSNHSHKGNPEEILIAYNSLDGDQNGVLFEGRASNSLHDIVIRDNLKIRGGNGNGISHEGGVDDAELSIQNNDDVSGSDNGINVKGFLFNDAKVVVSGNTDVTAKYGDGIHIEDTGYTNGSDVSVTNNHVHFTGDDGIQVIGVDGVDVKNNTIHDTGERTDNGDAISVVNSDKADVIENEISGAGRDGINIYNSDNADIYYNGITAEGGNRFLGRGQEGASRDGIHVAQSDYADIIGNDITSDLGFGRYAVNQLGAGRHGIFVDGGKYADIKFNDVNNDAFFRNSVDSVGEDGIRVENNYGVDVEHNDIYQAGDDGIFVYQSAYADVNKNAVISAGDDGIDVGSSYKANVNQNVVKGTDDNGIEVTDSYDADIQGNYVRFTGNDGIFADGIRYGDVRNNNVAFTERDGIDIENSEYVDVNNNLVSFTGGNGIEVYSSDNLDVENNIVIGAGENGIAVDDSNFINIANNGVAFSKDDGIDVDGGQIIKIMNNIVGLNGDDGIDVEGARSIDILFNQTFLNAENGIDVSADTSKQKFKSANEINIIGNEATSNSENGIYVSGNPDLKSIELFVDMNTASDNGTNGIEILSNGTFLSDNEFEISSVRLIEGERFGEFNSTITNNNVENNPENGLAMTGGYHDNIEVSANTFTNNDTGALFESGTIDLTNEGNTFTGGSVGLKFSPAIIGYDFNEEDSFDEQFESARFSSFAISGDPVFAPMTLVDNTIGAQTFDSQEDLYVELANGAFFAPGTPTILNALDSTYLNTPFGDVTPSSDFSSGFTLAQRAFFEDKFEHFNDNGDTGLFFFPLLPEIDQEDIFQFFGPNADALGGLQVTILGLPTIPGGVPIALNNIAPAAGENVDPNSPEALNAIATAAGGDDNGGSDNASCFSGSALGAIQSGQAMNFSYGSSAEDLLNSEAGCSI